ncbi:hypothetical protein ACJMK2_040584 [Sinanodonta woodiana]|uniref:Uncharacterized protein n=1 Tax=Sinanodonta woodiana TaxID=1069815 RepID=A0ABD3W222_SINWO
MLQEPQWLSVVNMVTSCVTPDLTNKLAWIGSCGVCFILVFTIQQILGKVIVEKMLQEPQWLSVVNMVTSCVTPDLTNKLAWIGSCGVCLILVLTIQQILGKVIVEKMLQEPQWLSVVNMVTSCVTPDLTNKLAWIGSCSVCFILVFTIQQLLGKVIVEKMLQEPQWLSVVNMVTSCVTPDLTNKLAWIGSCGVCLILVLTIQQILGKVIVEKMLQEPQWLSVVNMVISCVTPDLTNKLAWIGSCGVCFILVFTIQQILGYYCKDAAGATVALSG